MRAPRIRHGHRWTVQALAILIGLFLLGATAQSATAATGAPTPAASTTAQAVTAVAPTGKTIGCGGIDNLFTIPRVTGVQYLVNGDVLPPNDYLVSDYSTDGSVLVTARAATGFTLAGKTSWSLTIAAPECTPPTVTPKCGGFTVTNRASYAIGFSWGAHGSPVSDGYYPTIAPGATKTVTTKRSALDYSYAPADDGMEFSISQLTVPQNCAAPTPTTTAPVVPPTSTATAPAGTTTTGPAIITDGPADGGHLNALLLSGGLACALGAALTGVGLRRRLTR